MIRSRAYLASLLALALVAGSVAPSFAVTQDDVTKHQQAADDARKRAADAEALADRLAGEVADLDKKIEELQKAANALEPQIVAATKRTQTIQREVDGLNSEIRSMEREITETQQRYDVQQRLLSDRVESTYRQGSWFYLDVLLGSSDIGDFITRTEFVSRVIESNNNVAAELAGTEQALTRAKVKLDRSLKAVKLKRHQAREIEGRLRDLWAVRQGNADEQQAIQDQKSNLMVDSRANAKRLRALAEQEEAESDRIASELAGNGSGAFSGTMAWPVPASHRITSPFGPRICPYHGQELHPGIDIGRPVAGEDWPDDQRAIVAAGAGTVIFAGYRGGYGNTVIIDHGNGVTTLYAHQKSGGIMVGSGEHVRKGERIGTVGSTGNSTGPHLHFEVRVNGTPKNPMGYL